MFVKPIKSAKYFRVLMGIWVYFGILGLFLVFEVAIVGTWGYLWNILIFRVVFFRGNVFFASLGYLSLYVVIEELFSIFWGIFKKVVKGSFFKCFGGNWEYIGSGLHKIFFCFFLSHKFLSQTVLQSA